MYSKQLWTHIFQEAQELNEDLKCVENGDKGNEEVVALLDSIISNWIE